MWDGTVNRNQRKQETIREKSVTEERLARCRGRFRTEEKGWPEYIELTSEGKLKRGEEIAVYGT